VKFLSAQVLSSNPIAFNLEMKQKGCALDAIILKMEEDDLD